MTEQEIRNCLWKKVIQEYDSFKEEQLNKSRESIFSNAYQIAMFKDFRYMCSPDCSCLDIDQVKALMKIDKPIHLLFTYYLMSLDGGVSDMYDVIYSDLNKFVSYCNNSSKTKAKERNER